MEDISAQLRTLEYGAEWQEHDFLDNELLQQQCVAFLMGEDKNTEHSRYAMFRHVLATRFQLSDTEIAHYLLLTRCDPDKSMALAARMDLLRWPGLTSEQRKYLSQHPDFAAPLFQKSIHRNRQ